MHETPSETPISIIVGTTVSLGPVSKDMVPLFQRWLNDFPVQARIGIPLPGPISLEQEEHWYASVATGSDRLTFAVRENESMRVIGTCGLHAIDLRSSTAMFGILIGDPSARGKGYGTETTQLMLDYGFTMLGLHAINLTVAGFNLAGIRAYQRAGFSEAGRLREHVWYNGRRWDTILMDCLARDFTSPAIENSLH